MGRREAHQSRPGRRTFLTRRPEPALPWTDAARIMARCTGCGACADACPQDILHIQGGTHPVIEFTDACTFCGACAESCPEDVFDLDRDPPWKAIARIGEGCLEARGVSCRACEDACEVRALRARPKIGGTAEMMLDPDLCTGCGACVPVCPVDAIAIRLPDAEETPDAA